MRLALLAVALIGVVSGGALAATPDPFAVEEASVPGGMYYVGRATGQRDYRALANASTPGFLVMKREVGRGLRDALSTWAARHGYQLEGTCATCGRDHPDGAADGISWRDAALLANALSEARGLDPVYRDKAGQPIRSAVPPGAIDHVVIEPTLSGYRLPTIPEWHIALRGADKALAAGTYGADPRSPNALGLVDTTGPLAEWTASTMDLGDGKSAFFVCNQEIDGVRRLSACDSRTAGSAEAGVGFRLVRRPGR